MILIKPGAKIDGLRAEVLLGVLAVDSVLRHHGYDTVITEATGGEHREGSLHYKGLAVDIRSKHIPTIEEKAVILKQCSTALGENFDFILEVPNSEQEHFHLEKDYHGL